MEEKGYPQVCVRMGPEEIEFLDKITEYLHKTGRIEKPTRSETIRYAILNVLGPIVLKEIESRRV